MTVTRQESDGWNQAHQENVAHNVIYNFAYWQVQVRAHYWRK